MKKSAYTHEQFIEKVAEVNPNITVVGEYSGVEKKIEIACSHSGKNMVYAYTLLKPRNCCRQGYVEHRVPNNTKSIGQRKLELKEIFQDKIDVSAAEFNENRDKIAGLFCIKHNKIFSQWISALNKGIGCQECGKENKRSAGTRMLEHARKVAHLKGKAKYVSKNETVWLDSLQVPVRQHWLEDVKYNVDGYDPESNTVYLYHGKFWHGCPELFDPEMIHPILKVKMKQLHKQTILWENKIKEAGYNLVTKWGT